MDKHKAIFHTPENKAFPYQLVYKPLTTQSSPSSAPPWFRLVSILPGSVESDLSCELIHTQLCQSLDYEALSYCAGDARDCCRVLLNGHVFITFRSTYEALKRFRLQDRNRIFWIDQMCINQTDIKERDSQVLLMRDIYQNARCTQIWLGEASSAPPTQLAYDLVNEFLRVNRSALVKRIEEIGTARPWPRYTDDVLTETIDQAFSSDPHQRSLQAEYGWVAYFNCRDPQQRRLRAMEWKEDAVLQGAQQWVGSKIEDPKYAASWVALLELLTQRPWWHRCWIIQEAVVSRELHMVCGQSSLKWPDFTLFLKVWTFSDDLVEDSCKFEDEALQVSMRHASRLHHRINMLRTCPERPTLQSCMNGHQESKATDGRDKVYAMLGLVHGAKDAYGILPNYSADNTVVDVYLNATRAIVTVENRIEFLVNITGTEQKIGLPSWVPNWNAMPRDQIGSFGQLFQSGTSRPAVVEFEADERELKIRGWMIDQVAEVGIVAEKDYLSETVTEWMAMLARQPDQGYNIRTLDRLVQVLTMDWEGLDPTPASASYEETWKSYMETCCAPENQHFTGSRFFICHSGLAGLAPERTQVGHQIFIPFGGQMPLVIQQLNAESRYSVVGCCYVEDAMDHEVLMRELQGTVQGEDIILL